MKNLNKKQTPQEKTKLGIPYNPEEKLKLQEELNKTLNSFKNNKKDSKVKITESQNKKPINEKKGAEEETAIEDAVDGTLEYLTGKDKIMLYPIADKGEKYDPDIFLYEDRETAAEELSSIAKEYGIDQKDIDYAVNGKALFSLVEKMKLKKEGLYKRPEERHFYKKQPEQEPEKLMDISAIKGNIYINKYGKIVPENVIRIDGKNEDFENDNNEETDKNKEVYKMRLKRVVPREETLARLEKELEIAKKSKHKESIFEIKKEIEDLKKKVRESESSSLKLESETDREVKKQEEKIKEARKQTQEIKPSGLELEKKEFEDFDEKTIDKELEKTANKAFKEKREESAVLKLEEDDEEKVEQEIKSTIEQKKAAAEKIINALNTGGEKIDAEAKEKGYEKILWNTVEKYRKLPLKTKLLISAGLVGSASISALIGGTAGTAIATAAFAGSLGQRILGGFAAFVALEGVMDKKTTWSKKNKTAIAAVAGITVASGVVGKGIGYAFEQTGAGEWLTSVWGKHEIGTPEQIKELTSSQKLTTSEETPLSAKLSPEEIASLKEGGDIPPPPPIENDTVSKIEEDLKKMYGKENFSSLSPEEKSVLESDFKSAPRDMAETPVASSVYEVKSGDNLWNIIKTDLAEKGLFANMQEGQKIHLIDYMKDRLAEMSPEKLREVGISSGDIDKLSPGDKLSLSDIINKESNVVDALNKTMALSPEQIQNIESNITEAAQKVSESMPTEKITEQTINADTPTAPQEQNIPEKNIPVTPEDISKTLEKDMDSIEIMQENTASTVPTEAVEQALRTEVDTLFSKKGLFGFGAADGIQTPEWKTIQKMPIEELFARAREIDMEDMEISESLLEEKIVRMSSYLETIGNSFGLSPERNETVLSFMKRVIIKNLENPK